MDRLGQLRGDAGDSTLDTSSPPSEAFMSANESSSKYFSLSEVDSTFSISPSKDGSATTADSERTITEETGIIPNLSPIPKADIETFKIGKHIEAANILSGGVNIFDDNDNSYDGHELVIDDNIVMEEEKAESKLSEDAAIPIEKDTTEETLMESLEEEEAIPSKDTEVVLQIDGKNVDAIDIGNQLYLYRKEGEKELSAVQIIEDDQQQPSFKFLKVRENTEGNLEVYEEIQIEIPKEVPTKDGTSNEKPTHVPINDLNKVIKEPSCNKVIDKINKTPNIESNSISAPLELVETQPECKSDLNLNGKMKFNESRKSPLAFTPVTYHSTPNKEGIPLTKIMVDQQLHPSRHSDNVKKTIEVHTDIIKPKIIEASIKAIDVIEPTKALKLDTSIIEEENNSQTSIESEVRNEKLSKSLLEVKENNEASCKGSFESTSESKGIMLKTSEEAQAITEEKVSDSLETFKKEDTLTEEALAITEEKVSDSSETLKKEDTLTEEALATNEEKVSDTSETLKKEDSLKHEEIKNNGDTTIKDKIFQGAPLISAVKESSESTYNSEKAEDTRSINELSTEVKSTESTENKDDKRDIKNISQVKSSESIQNSEKEEDKPGIKELSPKVKSRESSILNTEKEEVKRGIKELSPKVIFRDSTQNIEEEENNLDKMDMSCPTKKNIGDNTSQKVSEIKSNKNQIEINENKDHTLNSLIKNIVTSSRTMIENKEVPFIDEKANGEKRDGGLLLKLNDKDDKPHYTDTCLPNATFSNKLKVNTENFSENKIKIDVVHQSRTETGVTPNTNIVSGYEVDQSERPENKIETSNICSSIDTKIAKECQKLDANIINKDNIVPKNASSEILIHGNKFSTEPQIVNDTPTKDIAVKVKDDSNNKNAKLNESSLALKQRGNLEYKKVTKSENESYKITSKDHPQKQNITKTIIPKQVKSFQLKKEAPKTKLEEKNDEIEVPFGEWTDVNRQRFLNQIKETKVPSNSLNTNQIKQTNDLNRRDVLKKIDSKRQLAAAALTKIPGFSSGPKFSGKMETAAFVNKSAINHQHRKPAMATLKDQHVTAQGKPKSAVTQNVPEEERKELSEQRIIINSQELINNTIEGIITRALKIKTTTPVHMKEKMTIHTAENPKNSMPLPGSLDDIEMKMNELHGFSFSERSSEEFSQAVNHDSKLYKSEDFNKNNKISNLVPFKNKEQQKSAKDTLRDDASDEEIIEHIPITGDIDVSKQSLISLLSCKETFTEPKMDTIITEKDFDKFARRNSVTYENCLTVKFDGKEKHNVVQTVVEKEPPTKKLTRNELMLAESKAKSSGKQYSAIRHNNQTSKIPTLKLKSDEGSYTKNYQSKVQIAYQSALTAKRNLECPISMIEDKPVKVVFMDTNTEYTPLQLNVQGQELSPKKQRSDSELHSASESLDSDILDNIQDTKPHDEKLKSKHQRKQVLTPVEPEMQLIEPSDLGFKVSPTKKRKTEEKSDKNTKHLVPKKSYLLNRSVVDEQITTADQQKIETFTGHNINTALDSLVKAAELIENQSESNGTIISSPATEMLQTIPVKRGRGRPRKYPLPEVGSVTNKSPSPQKKPRLIDAKPTKPYSDSDESSDGEIIRENWTMGKINENIVCPICSKLFRSEDVLFKHVKHCTGPSPNRSDSDKRSPRRLRDSQESRRKLHDSRSDETDNITDTEEEKDNESEKSKNRHGVPQPRNDELEVIVIEDTPIKQRPTDAKVNNAENKKVSRKTKHLHNTNLVCEFCGKTFRQLSYLVHHKLQHKNLDRKDTIVLENDTTKNSVFSCDICKKEFRKLHHLVQHRLIHNPSSTASRPLRKTSSEVTESKNSKMQNDDTSAGFRCEPCDKSFRKLHHLVEHRETHDGINKKVNTNTSQGTSEPAKTAMAHYCDICKKVFKKLQDLLEHKEQHYETSSEKSDDKSVKSSLSTKDIIHECSLCYMVFPNEHSLTKHTVICLRKKKQSAAKQAAKHADNKIGEETSEAEIIKSEEGIAQDVQIVNENQETDEPTLKYISDNNDKVEQVEAQTEDIEIKDIKEQLEDENVKPAGDIVPKKRHSTASEKTNTHFDDIETPAKIKKVDVKDSVIILDTPTPTKKPTKDKTSAIDTKKHKSANNSLAASDSVKSLESSDDEEIRYMLNPNYKKDESAESKYFMKISALKRSSLQIDRRSSKDFSKRRTSLQNPPKMPRLRATPVERKPSVSKVTAEEKLSAINEQSTDSDDSDVKYSFPEKDTKSVEKKIKRQSAGAKRKSLVGIAKRKSLGKHAMPETKPKKRTKEIEHRCDCGQLFSSAAMLSRHTTLAHTPPRIRKRRSPPPQELNTKPTITKPTITKPTITKPTITKPPNTKQAITKPTNTKPLNKKPKSDVTNSNNSLGVTTRKSSVSNVSNNETNTDSGKQVKCDSFKTLRSAKSLPGSDKNKKFK